MGGWKRTEPTTYLVTWPHELLIKAGYSERQRWRAFCLRGATLHSTFTTTCINAFDVEHELWAWMDANLTRAFYTPAEARPHLGGNGGGYLEVFRAVNPEQLAHAQASCSRIMLKHQQHSDAEHMHGRTNERTNEELTQVTSKSLTNLTRTPAYRFLPFGRKTRPADAAAPTETVTP